jgi:hypothetical protein
MKSSTRTSAAGGRDGLAFALVATLRAHGHLCNVLTHVGAGNWRTIEQAIGSILRPGVRAAAMDAIARNIVELVCDGRGVTGPIMHTVFFDVLAREAGADHARRIKRRITRLRRRMRFEARRQAAQTPDGAGQDGNVGIGPQRANAVVRERDWLGKAA